MAAAQVVHVQAVVEEPDAHHARLRGAEGGGGADVGGQLHQDHVTGIDEHGAPSGKLHHGRVSLADCEEGDGQSLPRPRDRIALAEDPRYHHYRTAVLEFLYRRQAHVEAA